MEKEKHRKERTEKDKANVTAVKEESSVVASTEKEMSFKVKHYSTFPSKWVLDSGATRHMSCSREDFGSLVKHPKDKKVYMGDGSEVPAYRIGTIELNANLVLKGVLHVPDFTVNLCSVSKLDRDGLTVTFVNTCCAIARDGENVICGTGNAGLYMLNNDDETALVIATSTLWHRRLGHLNMASIKKLESMAGGLHFSKGSATWELSATGELCPPCMEEKQYRVYNRHELSQRVTRRLQPIYTDTCGPFKMQSKAGAKTYVLFIDDMSRIVWCFFMTSKTETPEMFKTFKALTEKHSEKLIKRFRYDKGKAEYDNAVFQTILRENGISYEPSAPYTQNQNGVSEGMNRTIMEKARRMLLEARLPESFWA